MSTYADAFPGNFIEAAHIPEGREITLTIKRVADKGTVKSADGRVIERPVVYFEETDRGWAANKTNCRLLALTYGGDFAKWTVAKSPSRAAS